jgi:hypothetical protein
MPKNSLPKHLREINEDNENVGQRDSGSFQASAKMNKKAVLSTASHRRKIIFLE